MSSSTDEMRRIGDRLQSESSRLVEWMALSDVKIPYEVYMASCEVRTAVDEWTELRRRDALAPADHNEEETMKVHLIWMREGETTWLHETWADDDHAAEARIRSDSERQAKANGWEMREQELDVGDINALFAEET